MRILFLSTRRSKPSFRFRVEAMLPEFRGRGHECEIAILSRHSMARMWSYRKLPAYDAVFLQKRLLGRTELQMLRRQAKTLIYDLDDAVMFDGAGRVENRRRERFRATVQLADAVISGNGYLADLSRLHTPNVVTIPTCVDTDRFHPRLQPAKSSNNDERLTIGWTGSASTNRYLQELLPALEKFSARIELKYLSDAPLERAESAVRIPVTFIPWSPAVEISETATFDIGLMPLPDNPWTRGKCGFKALQYMSLGVPALCSAVGANCEIITHGVDGLLAADTREWEANLKQLLDNADLRKRLGVAGRLRIEEAYSLKVQAPRTVDAVESAVRRFGGTSAPRDETKNRGRLTPRLAACGPCPRS